MTTEEQKALGMPEKIYVTDSGVCGGSYANNHSGRDDTLYHRDDIVKALEAQNKMLADVIIEQERYLSTLRIWTDGRIDYSEAIDLAQQIGEKNDNR